jgi:coproporphyrinogen III oxidase-like Fe-S oxidoreductase
MIDEYIVTDDEYIGAGSGAFGYLGGVMYSNTFSLNRYAQLAGSGDSPIAMFRRMNTLERMRYDFLTGLFGLSLDKAAIEAKYAGRFARDMWKELAFFRAAGAIRDTGTHYVLTERGTYYWVVMMREFFTGVNRFREQLRAHIRQEFQSQRSAGRRARAPAHGPGAVSA